MDAKKIEELCDEIIEQAKQPGGGITFAGIRAQQIKELSQPPQGGGFSNERYKALENTPMQDWTNDDLLWMMEQAHNPGRFQAGDSPGFLDREVRELMRRFRALSQPPQGGEYRELVTLVSELEAVWSFDDNQRHTHTWHDKQDFMAKFRKLAERLSGTGLAGERAADTLGAQGWISVEERLPEAGRLVLVVWRSDMKLGGSFIDTKAMLSGGAWHPTEPYGLVTHWMPLPPAPLEEGEER